MRLSCSGGRLLDRRKKSGILIENLSTLQTGRYETRIKSVTVKSKDKKSERSI